MTGLPDSPGLRKALPALTSGKAPRALGNKRYCPVENSVVPRGHACFLFVGLREPGCISYL